MSTVTEGVRITVKPASWAERSTPEPAQFAVTYNVEIANGGHDPGRRVGAGERGDRSVPLAQIRRGVPPGVDAGREPLARAQPRVRGGDARAAGRRVRGGARDALRQSVDPARARGAARARRV